MSVCCDVLHASQHICCEQIHREHPELSHNKEALRMTGKNKFHHGFFAQKSEKQTFGLSPMQGGYEDDLVVVL